MVACRRIGGGNRRHRHALRTVLRRDDLSSVGWSYVACFVSCVACVEVMVNVVIIGQQMKGDMCCTQLIICVAVWYTVCCVCR